MCRMQGSLLVHYMQVNRHLLPEKDQGIQGTSTPTKHDKTHGHKENNILPSIYLPLFQSGLDDIFKPGTRWPQAGMPGFLELLLSTNVRMRVYVRACLRVCSPPRLLITSGVMWTPYDWSNKFYGFPLAAVVDIVSGCDVSIYMCRRNYPNKSKLTL